MVTRVVPLTRLAAKLLHLLLRLDTLGTGRDTTTGDTVADEAVVVAAAVKGDEGVVEAVLLVPVDVQLFNLSGADGVGLVGGVVDLVSKVGAAHHVVVHEEDNLLLLLSRERLDVVVGAEKTLLLAGPPGEAHAVVDIKVSQLHSHLEHRKTARTIIVDARALGDTVTVSAQHDALLLVTTLGLRDDVGRGDGLDNGVNVSNDIDMLAILQLLGVLLALLTTQAKGRNMIRRRRAYGAVQLLVVRVVDDGCFGARLASELRLGAERASAALDQGNVALDLLGVVGGLAAILVDQDQVAVDGLPVLGGGSQAHGGS